MTSGFDTQPGQHAEQAPSVTGKPLAWLRLDGLTVLAAALLLFATTHQPWWLVPALILVPDVSMAGYLRDARLGAAVYNLGHTYALPAAMSLIGLAGHHPLTVALGLVWLGHIGMDRLAGYGLKYDTDFQHTHLGQLGARPRRRPVPAGPDDSKPEGSLP